MRGEVPNLYHSDHAANEAKLIAGVGTIGNQLDVVSQIKLKLMPGPPNDGELEQTVLDELQVDPRVAAGEIEVASSDGCVTLNGSVGSMFERQISEQIARRVLGVVRVQNALRVNAVSRSDEEILADLQFNIESDSLLSNQPIVVNVRDAAVTFSGEVSDFNSKLHAARLASRVSGLRGITNDLKVRWTESTSDDALKQRIVSRLSSNTMTRRVADHIQVTVVEGVVTLAGTLGRSAELVEAERIAKFTDGVRAVDNRISLGESAKRDRD